jgi:hypothetical protein
MPDNMDEFGTQVKYNLGGVSTDLALGLGDSFEKLWLDFGPDVRAKIIDHVSKMNEREYSLSAYFIPYFQTLVLAKNKENIDDVQFLELVNVTGNVIQNQTPGLTRSYFKSLISFFEKRALHFAASNSLTISNDSYNFEYHGATSSDLFSEIDQDDNEYMDDDEEYDDDGEYDDEYEEYDDEYDEYDEEEDDYYDEYGEEDDYGYEDEYDDYDEEYYDSEVEESVMEFFPDPPPPLDGPVINFHVLDLQINSSRKSAEIKNTKGVFLINTGEFSGDGGRMDWSTGGLGDSVYVTLSQYNFNVKYPEVHAKVVKLTNAAVSTDPIEGEFDYDGRKGNSGTRFISYLGDIEYDNQGEGSSSFYGGVSLIGDRVLSKSKIPKSAVLRVDDSGVKKFKIEGYIFELGDSIITSASSAVTIYHKMDSIYHPSASVKYDRKNRKLIVVSDDGGYRYSPFNSSFTNMDITSDLISWDLDSDSLEMSILSGRTELPVIFQSEEYYNSEVLNKMMANYDFNPLMLAVGYVVKERNRQFLPDDIADYYNVDGNQVQNALIQLTEAGYLDFRREDQTFSLRKKSMHYYRAKKGRTDFDKLLILSNTTSEPNVIFDMRNDEMHINGIEKFYISEVLDVYIIPDSSRITLGEDRNFNFNGRLFAGNFEYVGKEFNFRYDSFLVNLNKIEKIQFYVQDDELGKKKVDNVISGITEEDSISDSGLGEFQGTSGVLYVNKPDNKSGRKMFPDFPNFKGGGAGSIVYFGGDEYLDGVYGKSLYFILPPFDLDSLSDSDPNAINFDGTFHSRGEFPPFEEKLHIMPDQSLGFDHSIPPEGYQLFEGDATLYNRVTLNKSGLRGSGKMDYMTSTMESDNYVFYPDSVISHGISFSMKEEEFNDITYPEFDVDDFNLKWLPAKDSMYISNNSDPINLYQGIASLDGTATITHGGVYGKGRLLSLGTETVSDEFNFQYDRIRARHADFTVASSDPLKPALLGNDIRLNFDLLENAAEINPEVEGSAALEFPYAQFKTSIPSAVWDLTNSKVIMSKPENVDISYSYFYTTREDLDSLAFNAEGAVYDINTLELKVSGIPFIKVADAKITPENGEVLILENARIGTLENTTIELDTLNGYHQLYNGTIDVISRNEFSGTATYQFVNAVQDTAAIELANFRLEPVQSKGRSGVGLQTVANGEVMVEDNLLISPGMYYRGNITMRARQPALELDGFVKLDLKKIEGYDTWITYSSNAEQQEVIFDYEKSLTEFGNKLTAGLHFDYNDYSLYSTFIYDKKDPLDEDFFVPSGLLSFRQDSNEYIIINQDKDLGLTYEGKTFAYNELTSDIRFEGPVSFIENSKNRSIEASVIGEGNLESTEINFNALLTLDFNVPASVYDLMGKDFLNAIEFLGALEASEDRTLLLYKLGSLVGDKAAKSYESRSMEDYTPLSLISPNLIKPFVFSEINFKWSDDQKAFYNDGGVLGLSHVLRTDLNAKLEGFFEISKSIEGEKINLFIKAAPSSWYYFGYEEGKLLVFTSNEQVNEIIQQKTNQGKVKIGDMVFALGDIGETLSFINDFRAIYYGIDEPYELNADTNTEDKDKKKVTDDEDDGF